MEEKYKIIGSGQEEIPSAFYSLSQGPLISSYDLDSGTYSIEAYILGSKAVYDKKSQEMTIEGKKTGLMKRLIQKEFSKEKLKIKFKKIS